MLKTNLMFEDLFLVVIPSFITAVTTWILSRRKYKAETKSDELENIDKAVKIWRELSEDLEQRLKAEIKELRQANTDIQTRFETVLAENEALKDQMSALEMQLKEARSENQNLLQELMVFNNNYHHKP